MYKCSGHFIKKVDDKEFKNGGTSVLLFLVVEILTTGTLPATGPHTTSSAAGTMVSTAVVPDHHECRCGDDCDNDHSNYDGSYGHVHASFPANALMFPIGSFAMMKYANTTAATMAITM